MKYLYVLTLVAVSSLAPVQAQLYEDPGFDPPQQKHNMVDDSKPHHSLLHAIGDSAEGIGHAAVTLIGATIGNTDIDLPDDTDDNDSWPFKMPKRQALYTVYWANGTEGTITKRPDGAYQIRGNGHILTMQSMSGGVYALMGEDGTMGTITPRLDGGYTMMNADGTSSTIMPRDGGGFTIFSNRGKAVAVIMPGPAGSKHIMAGGKYSTVR